MIFRQIYSLFVVSLYLINWFKFLESVIVSVVSTFKFESLIKITISQFCFSNKHVIINT